MKSVLFIVGMPRSATTSVCNVLAQHPKVHHGFVKEPGFFVSALKDRLYAFDSKGEKVRFSRLGYLETYDEYCRNYGGMSQGGVYLDGSTIYSLHCDAFIEQIKDCPLLDGVEKKFMVLHRDPQERAISHYKFSVARGEEHRTFKQALIDESEGKYLDWILGGYVQGGEFKAVVDAIERQFGGESLIVVDIDRTELFSNAFFEKLTSFLGVEHYLFDFNVYQNANINASAGWVAFLRRVLRKIRQFNPLFFEHPLFRYFHRIVMRFFLRKVHENPVQDDELHKVYLKYAGGKK